MPYQESGPRKFGYGHDGVFTFRDQPCHGCGGLMHVRSDLVVVDNPLAVKTPCGLFCSFECLTRWRATQIEAGR